MTAPVDTSNGDGAALRAGSGAAMDRPVRRRRFLAPWVRWGLALCAAAAAAAAFVVFAPAPNSLTVRRADLEISPVTRAPFQDYLPVRAEVAPLRTVVVTAVQGGEVDQVRVSDGATVSAGAPLALLSNPQLRLEVLSKEAEITGRLGDASAQKLSLDRNQLDREREVSETSYSLLKAEHDLDVRQKLHDQGYVSDAGVKTYADEAAYYRSRLATLKRGRAQEEAVAGAQLAAISETDARLRRTLDAVGQSLQSLVIKAPVAGRLTDFNLQPGQALKPGDPVGQIDSEGAYKLKAEVDEFYLGRVAPGQSAAADVEGRTVNLTVSRVLPQVTGGRFRTELTFEGPAPAGLRRGQTLEARITLGATRPALQLPNGPWLEGGGGFAFVLAPGARTAARRPISLGRRNPEQVEVTFGLKAGDQVVTSSTAAFDKMTRLNIH